MTGEPGPQKAVPDGDVQWIAASPPSSPPTWRATAGSWSTTKRACSRVRRSHRRELIDPEIGSRGGRIVKTTGDGVLVEFASAQEAVRCAINIQTAMVEPRKRDRA